MPARSAPILSRRALNRTLLGRQLLLERTARPPLEVIEHLVGLQAQESIDPYVGLWTRIVGFDPVAASALIERREAVRMGLMRTTIHLVSTADALGLAPVTAAVQARVFRSTSFAKDLAGLDPQAVLTAAREAVDASPMTPADLGRHLATKWPDRVPGSLAQLARYHLSLVQVPPRALWGRTARTANTTLEAWIGATPRAFDIEIIVRRYLAAFGPATVGDVRTWSWLTGLRDVVEGMRPELRTYRDERGRELFDVTDGQIVEEDVPAPVRFLPQYDNVFLSHEDRSRINGAMSWGLDFGWKGAILVDGGISGAWRVRRAGKVATMTVELGRDLTRAERVDLEGEADALARFLDPDRPRALEIVPPPS